MLSWLLAKPFRRQPLGISRVIDQMVRIGVQAVPMAGLTAFSVGLTLAMQGARELSRMGAQQYVPGLVSVSLLRELGPLLVAGVVIARSGSAITAELGTMKVSEEVEALEVMAVHPIRFLALPRCLAMLIMLPLLTVLGNVVGMAGGWLICRFALAMNTSSYVWHSLDPARPLDLYSGLLKSGVFAWLIATIACHVGLNVEGGPEAVGRATTRSVVSSLLAMLVANAGMTAIFFFF